MPLSLLQAWATTLATALGYVGLCGLVGRRRYLQRANARKLLHIGTGLLYLLTWRLYPRDDGRAPLAAASVPLLATLQFALVGAGAVRDPNLVAASTRDGRAAELLRGPCIYGLVHVAATLLWWRRSPAGIVALALLCAGDGAAEVVGSRAARWRLGGTLPHNRQKTYAGSTACLLCGAAAALPLVLLYRGDFTQQLSGAALVPLVAASAAAAAAVESLPLRDWDNLAVAAAGGLTAHLLFQSALH